jgi:hypothetical protein
MRALALVALLAATAPAQSGTYGQPCGIVMTHVGTPRPGGDFRTVMTATPAAGWDFAVVWVGTPMPPSPFGCGWIYVRPVAVELHAFLAGRLEVQWDPAIRARAVVGMRVEVQAMRLDGSAISQAGWFRVGR